MYPQKDLGTDVIAMQDLRLRLGDGMLMQVGDSGFLILGVPSHPCYVAKQKPIHLAVPPFMETPMYFLFLFEV